MNFKPIHRNPGVGCGIRLLAVLFVLMELLANPLSRKMRGKWLVMSSSPQPCRLGLASTVT